MADVRVDPTGSKAAGRGGRRRRSVPGGGGAFQVEAEHIDPVYGLLPQQNGTSDCVSPEQTGWVIKSLADGSQRSAFRT